jgi:hypothetical protein
MISSNAGLSPILASFTSFINAILTSFYLLDCSGHKKVGVFLYFFEMHGMTDWPWILLIFGVTVLFISMFLFSQKVIICTATGYIIGFVVAVIFSSDYYATYYGPEIVVIRENNFWSIWTLAYLAVIVAGVLLAGTQRIRMGMQKRKNCE